MKTIELSDGQKTTVSDEDYERVKKFKWHYHKKYGKEKHLPGHAARYYVNEQGKQVKVFLHRFILDSPVSVYHKSGDTLDNRRSNLWRKDDPGFVAYRVRKRKNATSRYYGVSVNKHKHIVCNVAIDGKSVYLGSFKAQIDAAIAHDDYCKKHCPGAPLNFPEK